MIQKFRVGHVSVQHRYPPCPPFFQSEGVKVDTNDGFPATEQVLRHPTAEVAKPHQDDINKGHLPDGIGNRFAEGMTPFENF